MFFLVFFCLFIGRMPACEQLCCEFALGFFVLISKRRLPRVDCREAARYYASCCVANLEVRARACLLISGKTDTKWQDASFSLVVKLLLLIEISGAFLCAKLAETSRKVESEEELYREMATQLGNKNLLDRAVDLAYENEQLKSKV